MTNPLEIEARRALEKSRLRLVPASEVAPTAIAWLWPGWLPFGKLVAFDGAPGVGKTTIITDLIARASRGAPLPGADTTLPPVTTMIAGVEDGWSDTIRPRLDAAGADLGRVHFVQASGSGEGFTLPRDSREMAEHARAVGARWLHIDAMMGSLSEDVNAYRDHEVRRALGPLKDVAEQCGMLVTFIRHPRKAGGSGVYAGGGSVAFSSLSRGVLFAGYDPKDPAEDLAQRRRVLAVAKMNGAPTPPALYYRIVSGDNGAGRLEWGATCAITADDLASLPPSLPRTASNRSGEDTQVERATKFLVDLLGNGARLPCDDVKARARAEALPWRTVERASAHLGVSKPRSAKFQGGSEWYLPRLAEPPSPAIPAIPATSATHTNDGGNGAIGVNGADRTFLEAGTVRGALQGAPVPATLALPHSQEPRRGRWGVLDRYTQRQVGAVIAADEPSARREAEHAGFGLASHRVVLLERGVA